MRGEPGSGPFRDGHSSPTCRLQLQTWAPGWQEAWPPAHPGLVAAPQASLA